jgi:hypothetical protein
VISSARTKKCLSVTLLLFLTGIVIYPARRVAQLRSELDILVERRAQLTAQIEASQHEHSQAIQQLAVANKEIARLEAGQSSNELRRLQTQTDILRQQVAVVKAELNKSSPPQPTILTDPTLREYISQMVLREIKGEFSSLFKELNLTPEQVKKAADAIASFDQECRDTIYHLPQGSLSPAQISQMSKELKTKRKELLLPFLGESGFIQYCLYAEEIPDHATIDMLNDQLGAHRLTEEQNTRLFQVVRSEPYELVRGLHGLDLAFWGPQEHIDNHLWQIAQSNQRILDQAANILTAEQLGVLSNVLSNGINTRITEAAAFIRKP